MPKRRELSKVATALLQIDTSGSTLLLTTETDFAKEIMPQLRDFLKTRINDIYGGSELYWAGDGGVYGFLDADTPSESCKKAILAAIEIQHSMVIFNTLIARAPSRIKLRFSIDFQTLSNVADPSSILEPRYSWFLKHEREFSSSAEGRIALTEDVRPHIGNLRDFCISSHAVEEISPSGGSRMVQIFLFDIEAALQTESLFSFLHRLKKQDWSLFPFLNHNINLVECSLESLFERRAWSDLLLLRGYLHQFFEVTGKYSLGIKAGHKFLKATIETGEQKSQAWILLKDLGWLELMSGNYEDANNFFLRAAEIFATIGNYEGLAYFHRYKAVLHYMRGEYTKAEGELTKAENEGKKCSTNVWGTLSARLMNNRGQLLYFRGEYQEALLAYLTSFEAFKALNDEEHLAIVGINIGKAYIALGEAGKAESALGEGLIRATRTYWLEGSGRVKFFLAIVFQRKSEITASQIFAREAQAIFQNIGAHLWVEQTSVLLSEFSQETNKSDFGD
jgi:tetratricopeptide (TPR) repeat protein